jgi:hypothetical protein
VTSPKPVAGANLAAVTANAKGGWIVGALFGQSAIQTHPLIFKLTGTKVSRSDPKFGTGSGVALDGVASTSTTTFATGLFTGMITGELARWSGTSWSFVKSFPQQGTFHWLNGIAAGPHGIAFAVGFKTSVGGGVVSIEWNGHAWIKAPAPNSSNLNTAAFAPGGTGAAWSAGYRDTGGKLHPLILRWTGHTWNTIASPVHGRPAIRPSLRNRQLRLVRRQRGPRLPPAQNPDPPLERPHLALNSLRTTAPTMPMPLQPTQAIAAMALRRRFLPTTRCQQQIEQQRWANDASPHPRSAPSQDLTTALGQRGCYFSGYRPALS